MGIVLSILAALFQATQDVLSKRALNQFSNIVITFALSAYGLPILLVGLFFSSADISNLPFWLMLVFGCALCDSAGLVFYVKSIGGGDLSHVIPLASVGPIFAMLIALLVFGEVPGPMGFLGIGLMAVGTYVVNLKDDVKNFFEPIRSIFIEAAPRNMVIACLIFACAWNFHRAGLALSTAFQ